MSYFAYRRDSAVLIRVVTTRLRRFLAIIFLFALSSFALADGVTRPSWEVVNSWPGIIAPIAMLVFDAWFIGVATGRGWSKSLALSALSNLASAILCPIILPPRVYFAWFPPSSGLNPNPLLLVVHLLVAYGLLSVIIEYPFWLSRPKGISEPFLSRMFVRCFLAHIIGLPLCFAIFLAPSRPYEQMERAVIQSRKRALWDPAMVRFLSTAEATWRIPQFRSMKEILSFSDYHDPESQWLGEYLPVYTRFSTGESRSCPIQINPEATGKTLDEPNRAITLMSGSNGSFDVAYEFRPVGEIKLRPNAPYQLVYVGP